MVCQSQGHKGGVQKHRLKVAEFQHGGRKTRLSILLRLLGKEDRVNVRQHTTGGNSDAAEELVQLLIVAHRQ
eukprot:5896373-Pleurochrysis_carterae.AAC.1